MLIGHMRVSTDSDRQVLDIEADVAAAGMWDLRGGPPQLAGVGAIRVAVHLEADAPRQVLQTLVAHALLWSPVASMLRGPAHLDVDLAGPSAIPP